jgi:hypothetical protein
VKHRAGADDGQARTVVMAEKEDQDPADSNGRDGAAESNNDQALVAPKGRCFGDEDAPTKFSLLQVRIWCTEPAFLSAEFVGCSSECFAAYCS